MLAVLFGIKCKIKCSRSHQAKYNNVTGSILLSWTGTYTCAFLEQKIFISQFSYWFVTNKGKFEERKIELQIGKRKKIFAETRDYSELMRVLRIWTRDLQIFRSSDKRKSIDDPTEFSVAYRIVIKLLICFNLRLNQFSFYLKLFP